MNLNKLKVVFGGCARDCADHLPIVIDNIRFYSSLFQETFNIIVENGSSDETKKILNENKKKNDNFIFCEHFNKLPTRGERLESSRNLIIKTIKDNQNLKNYDLFIMLDLDDMGRYRIKEDDISDSIKFLYSEEKIAAVFANQLGGYYDIWTLRDFNNFKNDIWVDVFKFLMQNKNSSDQISKHHLDSVKREILDKKTFSLGRSNSPVQVLSAFGGFGIYKMNCVIKNKNKYKGTQNFEVLTRDKKKFNVNYQKCEHVNFNEGLINDGKKLYILPFLINQEFAKLEFFPQTALKMMIK